MSQVYIEASRKSRSPPSVFRLWWTLAPAATCDRCGLPASTSPVNTLPALKSSSSQTVTRGRTVRLHSLVSPSGRSGHDVPPCPELPPSGARSFRRTDRPGRSEQQATGVCWLGWTGKAGLPAQSRLVPSTSPQTRTHLTSQSCFLSCNIPKIMRWGSGWRDVPGISRAVQSVIRRPWRCRSSAAA